MAKLIAFLVSLGFLGIVILAIFGFSTFTGMPLVSISQQPARTITIEASAMGKQANQTANFSASIISENKDKQTATDEVTKQTTDLVTKLSDFGIPSDQIQTQSLNVYQVQDMTQVGRPTFDKNAPWRVENSISIKLTDVSKAESLSTLLINSGASNVSGPNFTTEDTSSLETQLLAQAIKNARTKAEALAKPNGFSIGNIVSISESASSPVFPYAMKAADASTGSVPLEPGSQEITKNVTVIFQIR